MAKTPLSKLSKKRGRPRLELLFARYEIQISSWDFSWSFCLARPTDRWQGKSHFKEMATLTLKGRVIDPEDFQYPETLLRLVVDPWLDTLVEQPAAIGSLHINDKQLTGYVCIPSDLMPMLVSAANRLLFIELNGSRLRYRKALISDIHLSSAPE